MYFLCEWQREVARNCSKVLPRKCSHYHLLKSEVHRTSNDRQENPFPVPHPGETGEVNKVRHLGTMSHSDSQKKENIRPKAHDAPLTSVTKTERKQPGEQSKEEIEQALAEWV